MKKIALLVFCFFLLKGYGQNLVPNPSFEIDSLCPDSGGELNYAPPWHSAGLDPDYFNACAPTTPVYVSVPFNAAGYQYARTGNAYAGLYCYGNTLTGDASEYMQVRLMDTLEHEKTYCISFYVNRAIPQNTYNNEVAITKVGLYISDTAIMDTSQHTMSYYSPQIVSPAGVYLGDTTNWVEISGMYLAHGGERYITIGNFSAITDTLGMIHKNNASTAYYYVDDVSVERCNVGVEEIAEETINISPNPATNQFTIENSQLRINVIHIYSVLGKEVFSQQLTTNNQQLSIDVSMWKEGVYFVEEETEKGIVRKKVIKSTKY